ncbi:MAG: AAA family ATPase [Candidatus Woesearchaeota archaeon]
MSFYVIIRGPLGCGKTTISKKLSELLDAKYFSIDEVLRNYNLEGDREEGYISQKSFKQANDVLVPLAKIKLNSGVPIIFDGNFYWQSQINDLISKLDFPHYVFTLTAPLDICINRDELRNDAHGDAAARAVFRKSVEFDFGINIDVNKPIDICIKEILSFIQGD